MRLLAATLALLVLSTTTAAQALTCVPLTDFKHRGGKLVHITNLDMTIPPNYICEFSPCAGRIDFAGVVDNAGTVRGLKMIKNTWSVYPVELARLTWKNLSAVRYVRPTLNGKSVCVGMRWGIEFRIDDAPKKMP